MAKAAILEVVKEFSDQGSPFIATLSNGKVRLGFKGVEYIDVDPEAGGNAFIGYTVSRIRGWHDADEVLRRQWWLLAPHHRIVRKKAR